MNKKKHALRKDFYMEIRKSFGRFLSIFFIVALGVSLFSGIHATKPDMQLSGNAYVDENKLMDIKIVSTFGLTEEDVDVIANLPAIDLAKGAYSVDVLCKAGDDKSVLHVMSHTDEMNLITIDKGRMPNDIDECFVDQDFLASSGYQIGDVLQLESGTENSLQETLKVTELTIVGSGSSPSYFSLDRGSSTIGNGSVGGFLIVPSNAFDLDVYTEIYALVKDAEEAMAFTEEYDAIVEEAIEQILLVQNARCVVRRNDLAQSAQLEVDAARNELNEEKNKAENELSVNKDKLNDAELDIKIGKLQIESGKAEIAKAKADLEAGKLEMERAKNAYNQAVGTLKQQKETIEEQIRDLEDSLQGMDHVQQQVAQASIDRLKKTLQDIDKQISDLTKEFETEIRAGEKEISEAETLIKEKEAEIAKAEADLKAGEKELESGKSQLEDAKQEMESQIQEGEEQIKDAEEEISNIELPVWYVFDRSSIPEYTGYGDNADRIAALALVFPSIFFLVAALISLTTMTRMVEEQRTQIGTLKALGYSNGAIAMKYLGYALLATVGGSLFGVLLGEKLFPYVIIVAYKILYTHIPQVLVPYHWGYGLVATAIATACTGLATLFACYKELRAHPAILMRPEAPQVGKRTLVERIGFLWRHMSFSWKSSIRNLFRYKKRFFMTLIGIGGCMGLLIVGFGLRDSITSVATIQYEELQIYDAGVFLSDTMLDKTREELEQYLDGNQSVTAYTSVHMESISTQHDEEEVDAYLTVVKDKKAAEQFLVFRDRTSDKKYKLTDDGVILSEKTAKMLGVKVGDEMVLVKDGAKNKKVEITAICENYVSHYVYMTDTCYEKLYGEQAYPNNLLIKTDAGRKKLLQIGEEILGYDSILNVQYTADLGAQLEDMLGALDQVIVVLIIVAGMLSFVVLYNLNNINITERRRELATLRVLGFHNTEVAMYVYRENILLTFFGILAGCGIGKFLHYFTITTVEIDMAMFGRTISVWSYLVSALFTVGFSILVNWMMYFKLKKINMVESLKSVE